MKKSIKPFEVFLFIFSVFIVLAAISLIFPAGGIRIVKDLYLHFPGKDEILHPASPDYADISHLLNTLHTEEDSLIPDYSDIFISPRETDAAGLADSIPPEANDNVIHDISDTEDLRQLIFSLDFPENNDTVLDNFFKKLVALEKSRELLRIIHYGDSQIENDRISSSLRNRFQIKFGGSGIGMFPVVSNVPHSASVKIEYQGNWKRHTPLEGDRGLPAHNRWGLLMSYSSLTPTQGATFRGGFSLTPDKFGYRRSQQMDELSIFLGNNKAPVLIELNSAGGVIDSKIISPAGSLKRINWDLPSDPKEYSVVFQGEDGLEIYSVSLDGPSGVAVDNVPLRGSSGLEFSRSDVSVMKQMMKLSNVKLLLLQFGVNVVPNIVDDYTYYENALLRQFRFLRSVDPEICVIVIGVSDMSRRTPGGHYESFPNIKLIRDAQKNAAFRAGFAFWDLFEAMGGINSMPAWVMADPPLAVTDYTHFTFRGSTLLGDLLFNAILEEYYNYLKRTTEKIEN